MNWSVAEQLISLAAFMGDDHPHLSSIMLRVERGDTSKVTMVIGVEQPTTDGLLGYELHFHRNGEFISAEKKMAPTPPATETPPVTREAPVEEDEHETHSSRGRRR